MASDISEKRVPWGEVEDDSEVDQDEIYTEEAFTTNPMGQRVKVTRKIKKVVVERRVNRRAEERRQHWKKFGEARDKTLEMTTTVDTIMEFEYEKAGKKEARSLEDQIKKEIEETMARSVKSSTPWKDRKLQLMARAAAAEAESGGSAGGLRAPGGVRLAPGAVAALGSRGGRPDEANTIRVSNLSEDVVESDLGDLFSEYGLVNTVRVLRDKITGQSNRVAFVTFFSRKDAEEAMKKAQGRGLDHLIMHMEWSKPSGSSYK